MVKANSFKIDRKIINGNMSSQKVEEIVKYSKTLNKRIKKYDAKTGKVVV